MININYTNNLYKPIYWDYRKFDTIFVKHNPARMMRNNWSGDQSYWPDDSTLTQSTRVITPLVAQRYKLSGKVVRIKELVISGKYKVDAEKLAEKLLGSMMGAMLLN